MRLFNKMILVAAVLAASLGTASAALLPATLNVLIKSTDNAGIPGVMVVAIEFGMNGPSTFTKVGVTDGSGQLITPFTLTPNKNYNIFFSSHGYSPSIADQFNSPVYDPNRNIYAMPDTTYYSTFTLTAARNGVGRIKQVFKGASVSTFLFGGIYNMRSQLQAGTGIAETDGTGAGTLTVDNVPFAMGNTYNINLYDQLKNNGIGRTVVSDLGDDTAVYPGTTTIAYVDAGNTLDFNKSVPVGRVENATAQGTATAGASVEGVIKSTDGLTVPHMGIAIKTCLNGNQWNTWANSDENGRFQLYGLTNGVTYYMQIMGGCTWSQADNISRCYEPFTTANYNAADICYSPSLVAPGYNDIVYSSADVMYSSFTVNLMPPSIGEIKVCVKTSEGLNIPNANVNINPDGSPWPRNGNSCLANTYNDFYSSAGFSNANVNTGADGCATLGGLPSGNYVVNVWTPFSSGGNGPTSFNGNGDNFTAFGTDMNGITNWMQAHCYGTGANDYRVTIDTANAGQTMSVYNSSSAPVINDFRVGTSSLTYVITASSITSGEVKGTLTFPAETDLRANPIMITLYPNCSSGSCGSGNFTAVASSGSAHYDYSIHVASGAAYYMNVSAVNWGRVNKGGGDNTIHLESTGTVTVNMEFAPAGTLTGTLYKPDGTIFTPANNQYIWIDADNNNGWSNANLQKDGTFRMTDVLPGVNRLRVGSSGSGPDNTASFNYSLSPQPSVNIIAGSTATVNLNLVNARKVTINLDMNTLADASIIMNPGSQDAILGFRVLPIVAGSVMNGQTIQKMLVKGGDGGDARFSYVAASTNTQCGSPWPGGFCGDPVPSPAVYDFYLMRSGDFAKSDGTEVPGSPYPHFVLLSSTKNVIVASSVDITSSVVVNLTPTVNMHNWGNATIKGAVNAPLFFRQADYDKLGGNFDNFLNYLPLVTLYDENGKFKAAGIVVPTPKFIAENDAKFNTAFAQGYAAFQALFGSADAALGYEIRGLKPDTCYTAVVTTPNYPHYQSRVCTKLDKSTVTLNVDLASAGDGAVITGVVKSSTTLLAISSATVELSVDGLDPRTVETSTTGYFRFEGLSAGTAKIKVTAPLFAKAIIEQEVAGNNTYPENVFLLSAPGSITGTVYSQRLPYAKVQPGAQIVAYDDTYNGQNKLLPLPLLKTITGADGMYTLDGLVPGHLYKVFLKVTGKYTLEVDTTAINGLISNVDFTMLPKPLDIEVFAKKNDGAQTYEFTILNPQDFKTGEVTWSKSPYDPVHISTVNMNQMSSGELHGSIPLGPLVAGEVYVLHGAAVSLSNKTVVKEILFGKDYKGSSEQNIDDIMLGDDSDDDRGRKNNEASLDASGEDPSSLVIPAGALIVSTSGVIPSCSFTAEDKTSAGVADKVASLGAGAFAGSLYTIALSSVAPTEREMEITLAYDKSTSNINDLSVAQYNSSTAKWVDVPAVATINPVKGTVKVKLKKLASILSVRNVGPEAVFDGRQYVVRPQSGGSTTAWTLAVIRPSVAGGALAAGAKLKVFNYPNPFNLKNKAIANNHGAALPGNTYGTVIHVEVPAANGGPGHIRIYTLAGELVRDLPADFTAGSYNYVLWDGKNKGGQEVANGVYYGVVEMAGKSPNRKDATFKMAVIK